MYKCALCETLCDKLNKTCETCENHHLCDSCLNNYVDHELSYKHNYLNFIISCPICLKNKFETSKILETEKYENSEVKHNCIRCDELNECTICERYVGQLIHLKKCKLCESFKCNSCVLSKCENCKCHHIIYRGFYPLVNDTNKVCSTCPSILLIDGEFIYNKNNKKFIINYKNGIKDGPCILYIDNKKCYECVFINGELNDCRYEYFSDGTIKSISNYKKGELINNFDYNIYGNKIYECNMIKKLCPNTFEKYIKKFNKYIDESHDYVILTWHDNMKISSIKFYKNGVKDGPSFEWSKTGKLISEAYYKNNKLNGIYRAWASDCNMLFSCDHYIDGKFIKSDIHSFKNILLNILELH